VLAAVGYAARLAEAGEQDRRRIAERFNEAVLGRTLKGLSSPYLASPVLGTGVRVDRVDQLFLAALREKRRDIAEFAWGCLSERRQVLSKDGKPLQGRRRTEGAGALATAVGRRCRCCAASACRGRPGHGRSAGHPRRST
jgi:hypothetical protein